MKTLSLFQDKAFLEIVWRKTINFRKIYFSKILVVSQIFENRIVAEKPTVLVRGTQIFEKRVVAELPQSAPRNSEKRVVAEKTLRIPRNSEKCIEGSVVEKHGLPSVAFDF